MERKQMAKWLFGAGVIILIYILMVTMPKIKFDGKVNQFEISLASTSDKAEVGDIFKMDLDITNSGKEDGSMYVQCSILNEDDYNFFLSDVGRASSLKPLPEMSNCVKSESFTQTAQVTLAAGESLRVPFVVKVPAISTGNNVIFCDAFEQCYKSGTNVYSSESFKRSIKIVPNDNIVSNDNFNRAGLACNSTLECPGWANVFALQVCHEGTCMDRALANGPASNTTVSFDDTSIKNWSNDHEVILWAMGIILIVIAGIFVYLPGY